MSCLTDEETRRYLFSGMSLGKNEREKEKPFSVLNSIHHKCACRFSSIAFSLMRLQSKIKGEIILSIS